LITSNNVRNKELSSNSTEKWKERWQPTAPPPRRRSARRAAYHEDHHHQPHRRPEIREGLTKVRNGSVSYARQTAERTVGNPVGVVSLSLTASTGRRAIHEARDRRARAERASAPGSGERASSNAAGLLRRKAAPRARQTRNRLQRRAKHRQRRFETTVKQNRAQVEKGLKQAQTTVQERVSTLV
jgi:hypothetical protein